MNPTDQTTSPGATQPPSRQPPLPPLVGLNTARAAGATEASIKQVATDALDFLADRNARGGRDNTWALRRWTERPPAPPIPAATARAHLLIKWSDDLQVRRNPHRRGPKRAERVVLDWSLARLSILTKRGLDAPDAIHMATRLPILDYDDQQARPLNDRGRVIRSLISPGTRLVAVASDDRRIANQQRHAALGLAIHGFRWSEGGGFYVVPLCEADAANWWIAREVKLGERGTAADRTRALFDPNPRWGLPDRTPSPNHVRP